MARFAFASVMNVVVPGTGLILLGRPWLGFALAVWFGLGLEVGLVGWLIAPAVLPVWVTVAGVGTGLGAWVVAQGLLVTRIRFLRNPRLPEELALLRHHAEEALKKGDHRSARAAVQLILAIDDADVAGRVLWARLLTATSSRWRAKRAWLGAARLDEHAAFREEIRGALDRLAAG